MGTRRSHLKVRKALRHKARRIEARKRWGKEMAALRQKKHQAFAALLKTLAILKAQFKKENKNEPQ